MPWKHDPFCRRTAGCRSYTSLNLHDTRSTSRLRDRVKPQCRSAFQPAALCLPVFRSAYEGRGRSGSGEAAPPAQRELSSEPNSAAQLTEKLPWTTLLALSTVTCTVPCT